MPIVWSDCPTYALLVEILQFNLDHCQAEISLYCGHHSVILLSHWLTSPHTSLIGQMSCTLLVYQSVKHSSLSGLNSTVASGQLFSYFLRMTTWRSSIRIVTTAWLPTVQKRDRGFSPVSTEKWLVVTPVLCWVRLNLRARAILLSTTFLHHRHVLFHPQISPSWTQMSR